MCINCDRTEDDGAELVTVPCGDILCEDCAPMHADCLACGRERFWEAADYYYDRFKEE